MTKRLCILMFFLIVGFSTGLAQKSYGNLYHPEDNASQSIKMLIKKAKKENKHLMIQLGGNWCIWCYRLEDFIQNDSILQKTLNENFLVYHLNYSKENKNEKLLKKFNYPQRFGFPALLILNQKGWHIHTQDSGLLEEDKSYNHKKILQFLQNWSPGAFNPGRYVD